MMFKKSPMMCRFAGCLVAFFIVNTANVNAQFGLDRVLNQVDRVTNTANRVANTVERFQNLAERIDGMSTTEFDNNVVISRGRARGYEYDVTEMTRPKFENGRFTNFQWKPVSYFDGQLFPSTIVSMYFYKKTLKGRLEAISRPLGFRISSEYSNIKINWEISCEGDKYFEKVTGTELYEEAGREQHLMPPIGWRFDVLLRQESTSPITVNFTVSDDKGHVVKKIQTLQVRSINDCIYGYLDMNLDYLLTGYIQEEHPEIPKIFDEAMKTKMISAITGYQEGVDATHMQVAAIWRVLLQRGFRYSSITTTAGHSDKINCQVVRTFEKAIKSKQVNCVDATILLASILRKMKISTVIVLTTDHCFLGYYTDATKKELVYLETTLLTNSDFIKNAKTPQQKTDAYIRQFELAMKEGMNQYESYKAKDEIEAKIDVDKMRKKVAPIPFASEYAHSGNATKSKSTKAKAPQVKKAGK